MPTQLPGPPKEDLKEVLHPKVEVKERGRSGDSDRVRLLTTSTIAVKWSLPILVIVFLAVLYCSLSLK